MDLQMFADTIKTIKMVETTNLEFFIEILYTCNSVFSEIRISSFFHFYSSATNFTPRSSPDLAI